MKSQSRVDMSDDDDRDQLVHVVGKNSSSLVPICIMNELVPVVSLFMDERVRNLAGVPATNIYLFASTSSDGHVSGTS